MGAGDLVYDSFVVVFLLWVSYLRRREVENRKGMEDRGGFFSWCVEEERWMPRMGLWNEREKKRMSFLSSPTAVLLSLFWPSKKGLCRVRMAGR